jgi:hypothetical protein
MKYIESTKLLSWNRWDIIIKYYYVYVYLLYQGNPPKWILNLYSDHILVLNGGKEEKTVFQPNSKDSVNHFIQDFNKLISSILSNGFNVQHNIPITHKGTILNGGHRIAISSALNLSIPYKTIKDNITLSFPSHGFKDRQKYKHIMPKISDIAPKNSLMEWQNDLIALNLVIKQKNYRIILFFSTNNYTKYTTQIEKFIQDNKTDIVYTKEIILSRTGIYKLTQHLYYTEKHVNVNWKTNQIYSVDPNINKYKSTIMVIHSNDNKIIDQLSKSGGKLKNELREIMNGHHQIHITDNEDDTNMVAKLVLHNPSIEFINIASVNNYDTTLAQLESYKKYIHGVYKIYKTLFEKKEHKNKLNDNKCTAPYQSLEQFKDMFCLSSSYILALYGIRKNLDIDFIYDNEFFPDILNQRVERISHNKYQQYYQVPIKDLIHDPNKYFYFMGCKCLKLENIKNMKLKRNESPKDVLDIQLITDFNKTIYLKHLVTIITITHILPSAPSTEIIQKMLDSLHQNVEGSRFMTHMIFVDSDPSNKHNEAYMNNLKKLREKYNNLYIIDIPNSGLKTNYINGIKLASTPYLYFIEHDWIFNERIPTTRFVDLMQQHPDINYIKMSKRDNMEIGGWDKILTIDSRFKDCVKTDSWTNHPHIVRKNKWLSHWIKIINPHKKSNKSYGIEEVLYKEYQKDIKNLTFKKAHQIWGCYNWLSNAGESPIKHIDGSLHYVGDKLDGYEN